MDLSKNNDVEAVITIDDDDDDDDNDDDDDDDDDSDDDENVNNGNLEFSVSEDKVEDVISLKEKLVALYGVTINEDIKAKETDDKNAMRQWFNIVGPLENCRQAKAFILASCDPGQAAIFEFDPTLHKILSCESQKMRIEKESKTLLLFDSSEEGSVVIQGADEISVGIAMSLLEAAAYEASVGMMSPSKEHQALQEMFGKGDNGVIMGCSKIHTESSVINCDDRMEVDISDLELATGGVALDVMKSPDPEIQRLVKCGRDKSYADDEIREVLEKSKTIPMASAFFRALHTCRNMKAVSSESSVHQSNKSNVMTPYSQTQPSDDDFKLDFTLLQRDSNSAQEAKKKAASVTNKNGTVDRELSDDDIRIQRVVQAVEKSKTPSRMRYPANQAVFGDSVQSVEPVKNLMSISDTDERKRLAEANQQLNRKLFLEQSSSSASASPKVFSYDRVANLDEFLLPVDVNISDSSLEVNVDSPSVKKRHKKKKKKKNIDLTVEESDYRSRSPNKPIDQGERAARSQHGSQTRQPNTAAATVTQAGHHQFVRVLDYFHKKPGVVSKQTDNAPTPKPIPNPPALLPPFAFAASRSSVGSNHLRYIVIDGSNIAMAHGNGKFFSCRGIEIAVQHFRQRGHREITVFVPQWRRQTPRFEDQNPIRDQDILENLKEQGIMNFTPSRRIPGKKNIVCYDDRFILRLAQDTNGIVVSNDNYRDLYMEKPEWAEIIETRVLSFTFVKDLFMLPDDPLGRGGPNLDDMLSVNSKTIQSYPHNNSRFQLHSQAPNARQQFQQNPQFFAQQTPNSCAPVMPTGQWQAVPRHSRQGYPNTGQWIRPPHAQDIGPWTNKINHMGIPVQTGRFPFRTSSAPFATHNIRENPKFIVERAPSSQSSTATGSFLDQTPKHQTNSRPQQQHMKFGPSPQLRSHAETKDIKNHLREIFPEQEEQINELLLKYNMERDLNVLSGLMLGEAEEM